MLIVLAESARVTVSSWFEVGAWQTPRIGNSDDLAVAFFVLEQSVSSLAPDFSRRTTAGHMSVCLSSCLQSASTCLSCTKSNTTPGQVRGSTLVGWMDGWGEVGRREICPTAASQLSLLQHCPIVLDERVAASVQRHSVRSISPSTTEIDESYMMTRENCNLNSDQTPCSPIWRDIHSFIAHCTWPAACYFCLWLSSPLSSDDHGFCSRDIGSWNPP